MHFSFNFPFHATAPAASCRGDPDAPHLTPLDPKLQTFVSSGCPIDPCEGLAVRTHGLAPSEFVLLTFAVFGQQKPMLSSS
jgi:hypothetical protein